MAHTAETASSGDEMMPMLDLMHDRYLKKGAEDNGKICYIQPKLVEHFRVRWI